MGGTLTFSPGQKLSIWARHWDRPPEKEKQEVCDPVTERRPHVTLFSHLHRSICYDVYLDYRSNLITAIIQLRSPSETYRTERASRDPSFVRTGMGASWNTVTQQTFMIIRSKTWCFLCIVCSVHGGATWIGDSFIETGCADWVNQRTTFHTGF